MKFRNWSVLVFTAFLIFIVSLLTISFLEVRDSGQTVNSIRNAGGSISFDKKTAVITELIAGVLGDKYAYDINSVRIDSLDTSSIRLADSLVNANCIQKITTSNSHIDHRLWSAIVNTKGLEELWVYDCSVAKNTGQYLDFPEHHSIEKPSKCTESYLAAFYCLLRRLYMPPTTLTLWSANRIASPA